MIKRFNIMQFLRFVISIFALSLAVCMGPALHAQQKRAVLDVEKRAIKKHNNKVSGPRVQQSSLFATEVERKLIRGIKKTLVYLNKTQQSLPKKSTQRLQILERIMNLHMEQARYLRSEEERVYDAQYKRWESQGKKGREPRLNNRRSEDSWRQIIKQSSLILKDFPKTKSADEITFNKAVALQYLGKEKDAARMYNQLIRQYPNSPIVGESYAALGDYYFDRNDYRNSLIFYKKTLKYKRSKRYLWSLFKSGWSSYNLGKYAQALSYWKAVVRESDGRRAQGAQLKEEALRDMVYAFAELKQIDSAIAYYRKNRGNQFIAPLLVLLSQILSDQGDYGKSIAVLKKFQKLVPYDEGGPDSQKEIISLYAALGRYKNLWGELARFPALYGPKSSWASKQSKDKVIEANKLIKDQMLYYASYTHQTAIKDDSLSLNLEAKKGYLLFLKNYPTAPETPGILYYIGDIDYFLKNYASAGGYYKKIVNMGKAKAVRIDPKQKKYVNMHQEVAVFMVNSYVKDFEKEFDALKRRKADFKKPLPLSQKAKNYIEACSIYRKWYPRDIKRIKSCDVGIATVYYQSGYKKQAFDNLKLVALKYPNTKEGAASVDLLIPLLKDDKAMLLSAANRFLRVPAYRKGKMGVKLRSLQRGAEKEKITAESDVLKRAQMYEAQARKYPRDSEVDKLWYNAAVDYLKAGSINKAIAAYLVLIKRFGKTPQGQEALLQVAQIYERQLDFENASTFYLDFTKKFPKSKESAGALYKSCELQIALNTPRSLTVCSAFASRYPDGAKAVIEDLIKGAERAKRYDQMKQMIKTRYLSSFKLTPNEKIVALYQIYKITGGKSADARQAAAQIKSTFQSSGNAVSGEALRYVGELYFKEGSAYIPQFYNIKLTGGGVDNLIASIQKKANALAQLEGSLNRVVSTKDAYWGVAALFQMGAANEHFALLLSNPPAIDGAKPEDVLAQLKGQIDPIKASSVSWYKLAMETVSKFKVYNEWSIKSLNGLSRASGSKIQFDDYVVQPDFLGNEIDSSLISDLR
jgi:TolA-binding protein